jgi:glyoxylase-like metal-dependent hydrolase (beta-lactamase superfamily II)
MFTEIAPDVFAVAHRLVDGKNTIVFGTRGALAVDACNFTDEGQAMAAFIRGHGRTPDRLAFTHGHGDHVLGSGAFAGADVYAQLQTPLTIERDLPGWAERYYGSSVANCAGAISRPNVLFDRELRIDLGRKTARLFATPGHCRDAVCVWLEEDRILCAGDTVVTGIVPAIHDGDSRQMEDTLRTLLSLDAQVLVPGHGPVLSGAEVIREHLLWTLGYLRGVRHFVEGALRDGMPSAQVPEAAEYGDFVGDRLPLEPFGMLRRHRMVVARIVAELQAEERVGHDTFR